MEKCALVTGASSGIGRGVALHLASIGYNVVVAHYGDIANAAEVKGLIEKEYRRKCVVFDGDLGEEATVERLAQFTVQACDSVSVLVNNAGITRFERTLDMSNATTNTLFSLNFRAPVILAQRMAQHMIRRGIKGSVVNIASTRGIRAYPGDAIYGGLKAALIRSSQSMALDLAPYGIRVNCIAPGSIRVRDTELSNKFYRDLGKRIPLGRVGTPQDVGYLVEWLVSERSEYMTGVTIRLDGGLILPGMPERLPDGHSDYGWGDKL